MSEVRGLQKFLLLLLTGFLTVSLLTGCVREVGTITGRVGFPVISDAGYSGLGVAVVVLDGYEYTYTTPDGAFSFRDVSQGVHTLTVKEGYFTAQPVDVQVTRDGVTLEIPVQIDRMYFSCAESANAPGSFDLDVFFTRTVQDAASVRVNLLDEMTEWVFPGVSEECALFDGYFHLSGVERAKDYTFRFTDLDAAGQEMAVHEKTIYVPALTQLPVTDLELGHPTFRWTEVAPTQQVSYALILVKQTPEGSIYHDIYSQGYEYTVQSTLTAGSYVSTVRATISDPVTGTLLASLTSNVIHFDVP